MGIEQKILVRAKGLATVGACALTALFVLSACGQKGNLYIPSDPDFKDRATLPDIVRRQLPGNMATPPAAAASSASGRSQTPSVPAEAASAGGR